MGEPTIIVQGQEWHLFGVEYPFDGGKFSFHIYALSWEDAEQRLKAIAANGTVYGKIAEVQDAGPDPRPDVTIN